MKILLQCSKCWGVYPADLKETHTKGNPLGPVYEYVMECMKCMVSISAFVQEIEEVPELLNAIMESK